MIGQLRGTIIHKQPPLLVLDVNGVGYEILAPMTTFYRLADSNQQTITLLTHLVVREDAQTLYGFLEEQNRRLFRALIKVNGVGPKLALTILSGIEPQHFVQAVLDQDAAVLTGIPGIGRKTAERLIIETKDALANWQGSDSAEKSAHPHSNQHTQDAISALEALGYKSKDAQKAIKAVNKAELSSEQLIRAALQQMMTGVS